MTDRERLSGKVVAITGASSGIGAATARAFLAAGCRVVLAARREDRLRSLARELGEEDALTIPTDVTEPQSCEALVSRTIEHFGALDILVNNAGVGYYAPMTEADPEDWRAMFDVNVLGSLYPTRPAARYMKERGSGHVFFISSISGRRVPTSQGAVYSATKYAVGAIAEGLRLEVSPSGVRVTCVEPGLTRTEFPAGSNPDVEEFYRNRGYRPLEAEDIAAAIVYAASQPEYVNVGEVLLRSNEQTT